MNEEILELEKISKRLREIQKKLGNRTYSRLLTAIMEIDFVVAYYEDEICEK